VFFRKGGFVCRVCIGLDESFRTNYFIPNNQTELDSYEFLGETVDKVSWIFRSVDWDGDGKYDDIGIGYDSQVNSFYPHRQTYSRTTRMRIWEVCQPYLNFVLVFPLGLWWWWLRKHDCERIGTILWGFGQNGLCRMLPRARLHDEAIPRRNPSQSFTR